MKVIKVHRTDGTERNVVIYINRADNKYQFVNLTTGHICACKFDTIEDALYDLISNVRVESYKITDF